MLANLIERHKPALVGRLDYAIDRRERGLVFTAINRIGSVENGISQLCHNSSLSRGICVSNTLREPQVLEFLDQLEVCAY